MIELLPDFPDGVVAAACRGHVTRQDYDTVLIPAVETALGEHETVRLYYEIGADFDAIDPGAVWEDFRVGMGHLTRWSRIAIVTDVDWIRHAMNFFRFLMPGEIKVFADAERSQARDWILAD